jgi:hypothetical protein
MNTLRKIAKIFVVIFIFIVAYVTLLNYQIYAANQKAARYCDLAVIGESFEVYKKKVRDNIDENAVFNDKKAVHNFKGLAPLSFGAAFCEIKTDDGKIVSKEFSPTYGG